MHTGPREGGLLPVAKDGKQAANGGNSNLNSETLLDVVRAWTANNYPALRGQAMHPSPERIYSYVLQNVLRLDPQAQIRPDMPASDPQAQRFLAMMPAVAKHLATDFKRAYRLLAPNKDQAGAEMDRFLRHHAFTTPPRLNWAAEHTMGIYEALRQQLQGIWGNTWREAEPEQKARLWIEVYTFLRASPVASPSQKPQKARELLLKQLEADQRKGVPPEAYNYGEPLDEWLLRPLLTVPWFFEVCKALAELAREVPALVQKRASEAGTKRGTTPTPEEADATAQETALPVPPMPQGSAPAEAICAYALLAWRLSAGAAGDAPLLLDGQRTFSPAEFQAMVALALKATELLLWDETLPLFPLPPQSPERRRLLRQALLPARLPKLYEDLRQRALRHQRPPAASLPRWAEWEIALDAALDRMERGLASSVRPEAITPATLGDLLRQPRAALVGQYLYHASLREWLREMLSDCPLDGAALLAYCQQLAEAAGDWPPNTPGAPASAAQAGRAILWLTKRYLEAKIEKNMIAPLSPAPASDQSAAFPQREDGGLVIWLGAGPLPPEALELATAVAPLITSVLWEDSWEAARQGQPLLAAGLKEGHAESIELLLKQLEQRAYSLGLPNAEEAAQEAWDKLQHILYHFAPPAEISELHLKGDTTLLTALDIFDETWYIPSISDFESTGSVSSFAKNFIHYSMDKEQFPTTIPEKVAEEPPQPVFRTLNPQEEDRAILEVLALIVEKAQRAQQTPAREEQLQADVWLLVQDIFAHNTGRQLVDRLASQGEPLAEAMLTLWQQQLASAQEDTSIIQLYTQPDSLEQTAALARLLISPAVQQSPARRRAVGDLFERPMHPDALEHSGRLGLGMLERQASWALRTHWQTETLRALGALDDLAPRQRQALGAHLLAQEPTALTLKLLEHSGWTRPLWLRVSGPETASGEDEPSRQLFMVARKNWMTRLSGSAIPYRTRALAAEWLGYQFWDRPWRERLHEQPYAPFYRTLLAALPLRLLPVLQAAWVIASQQKLASLSELLGLTGCLPPQLPAQIDHRFFFEAMQQHLHAGNERQPAATERSDPGAAMPAELRHLRRALRSIRWRTFAWFQALGGLADDNQQRIVLAAMSACAGKAEQLDHWIEGQISSQAQTFLADETRRWHHQSSITRQNVPSLMQTAAVEVKPIWQQLRRPPHF
jgi:hypothetical protein